VVFTTARAWNLPPLRGTNNRSGLGVEVRMIKRKNVAKSDQVKVSFVLPEDDPRLPASVVGDFNEWDPDANPLKPRRNKTHSAVVTLTKGEQYLFRYRCEDGTWFNDDQADDYKRDKFGNLNCVLVV
jgi:hypothetical protein